jgi:hypothetical protein
VECRLELCFLGAPHLPTVPLRYRQRVGGALGAGNTRQPSRRGGGRGIAPPQKTLLRLNTLFLTTTEGGRPPLPPLPPRASPSLGNMFPPHDIASFLLRMMVQLSSPRTQPHLRGPLLYSLPWGVVWDLGCLFGGVQP